MAIVKMKRLQVVAMQEEREELLTKMQRLGCVEIADIDQSDLPTLATPDGGALNDARSQHQAGEQALEILKGYSKASGGLTKPRPVISEKDLFSESDRKKSWEYIQQIIESKQEIATLQGEKTALEAKQEQLLPWKNLSLALDTPSTAKVTLQFGTLPQGTEVATVQGSMKAASDLAELTVVDDGKDGVFAVLTAYQSGFDASMEVLKAAGWSRTNFRGMTGSAKENLDKIQQRLGEIDKKVTQKEESLGHMGEYRPNIHRFLDGSKQMISKEESKSRLRDTENTFYLDGWVEADKWPELERLFQNYTVAWDVEDPKEEDIPNVPVKLKNSKLSRSLSVVTEMYSLPAYNGVDPNPLMMPFFVFFYGMMMNDIGYGLLMLIGTQMVLSKGKPKGGLRDFCELFRMLGISTIVFGVITGSFFGNFIEAFLKCTDPNSTFVWFYTPLFTPLDDTIDVLYASIAFGAVHVLTGMAVSFCKKVKDGKTMDALMDEGSWWLLFVGTAMGALGMGWIVCYAGLAALVLTQGRNAKGPVGKVVGGVASLYDITGYFGDLLSYARLMALMLAGSVIAKVFNDLGVITNNAFLFLVISLMGNSLNFLLNLLGCFVHTLRLQCLEFFGKFYQDGGKAFKPLNVDTKYVDVQQ